MPVRTTKSLRRLAPILGGALCCLLAACGDQPILNAVGSYSDVAILTDTALLPVATELEKALEAEVYYSLRPEKMLKADIFDLRDLDDAEVYKNVIVIGLIDGRDRGSKEIQKHLAGESMQGLVPKRLYLAERADIYARNQNVLFLAGHDRNLMQSGIRQKAAALRGQIESDNRRRLRDYLFGIGRNLELEEQVREKGGFQLTIPEDWKATRFFLGEDRGSVEIASTRPTRTVAVMWEPEPDPTVLEDRERLLEMRRQWASEFLEEELQDAGGFEWTRTLFATAEVPMLAGFWEADTYGGPFRTIFYHDPRANRIYGINLLTYAPNLPKHVYMREALAVAETFRP